MKETLVAVLCILCSSTGWAGKARTYTATEICDDLPDCRDHLIKGNRATKEGRNQEAVEQYYMANSRAPSPQLMYNIGRLEYSLGHNEVARLFLKKAQKVADPTDHELTRRLEIALRQLPPPPPPPPRPVPAEVLPAVSSAGPAGVSPSAPPEEPAQRLNTAVPLQPQPLQPQPLPSAPNNTQIRDVKDSVFCIGTGCRVGNTPRPSATQWILIGAAGALALVGSALAIRYVGYPDPPGYTMNYLWH